MTNDQAIKLLREWREPVARGVPRLPEARTVLDALDTALAALRSDSDVRREERERIAEYVQREWDHEIRVSGLPAAIRALEDER